MASLRSALWWSLGEISRGKAGMPVGRVGLREVRPLVATKAAKGRGRVGTGGAKTVEAIPRTFCEIKESLSKSGDGRETLREGGLLQAQAFFPAAGSCGPKVYRMVSQGLTAGVATLGGLVSATSVLRGLLAIAEIGAQAVS